jgi:two-component sensor histidine kinase
MDSDSNAQTVSSAADAHPVGHSLWITGVYLVISAGYVLFSDAVLSRLVTDPAQVARLQSIKGIAFVALTAIIVFLLLSRAFTRLYKVNNRLKAALDEKNVLLREVHHRVKNNIAVMSGLVSLQLNEVRNSERRDHPLEKTRDRMEVMGLIHNMLYSENQLARVDLADVLDRIATQLQSRYAGRSAAAIERALEHVTVDVGRALPLGLILNEALTNALSHAFSCQSQENRVTMRLEPNQTPDGGVLTIEDNGAGLPESADELERTSLGFRMMHALANQLRAELVVENDHGTRVRVHF